MTQRYLRVGVVPKDARLARGEKLTRLGVGMTNGFMGLVQRLQPQSRLAPVELAPFGVTDYEIEDSIDAVADAVRQYTTVIDQDARRAAERASRWTTAPSSVAAVSAADLRALDAGIGTAAAASPTSTGAQTPIAPLVSTANVGARPEATFRAPKKSLAGLAMEGWAALSAVVIPLVVVGIFLSSVSWSNVPIWLVLPFVAIPGLFVVGGVRRVARLVYRWRSAPAAGFETLAIGPDGIWLPEMGRIAWGSVGTVRTERAGFNNVGGGPVERWRLIVTPAVAPNAGRDFAVDADVLSEPFDEVLDLIRVYHSVVETG